MTRMRGEKRVTLQDIALETGYSVNTVSRALRGKSDISPATIEQIRRTADEMGYSVNQIASSLRSGRTHIFAVILGGMTNPFYGIMADTIQNAAREKGYSLMIMCSREDPETECSLVEQAISRCVDGVLLFPTSGSSPTVRRLKAAGMPFVLMSRCIEGIETDAVVADEEEGGYLAARHLIEAGHRKLAFISSGDVVYSLERRLTGFRRACAEAGIPDGDQSVFVFSQNITGHRESAAWEAILAEKLVSLKAEGFTGLFLFCDMEAWHALSAMQRAGSISKDDLGIVGFDNLGGFLSFPIPLCSVDCGFEDMARAGVKLLRDRIHGDAQPPVKKICPVRMVCRHSCGNRPEAESAAEGGK